MKIVFHIGMGKTGTSTIQKGLAENAEALRAAGMGYLGMWFDLISPEYKGLGNQTKFYNLSSDQMAAAAETLLAKLRAKEAEGLTTFIYSNESLAGKSEQLTPFLARLTDLGVEIRIIGYIRNPRDWLPSAYVQWGIRHKVDAGPIEPYARRARKLVTWYRGMRDWLALHGSLVEMRSYEAAEDVFTDFAKALGVTLRPPATRVLERGTAAEIALRALFNDNSAHPVLPEVFDRTVMAGAKTPVSAEDLIARHFDYSATDAVIAENAKLFDQIAKLGGFDPRASLSRSKPMPTAAGLRQELIDHLSVIVLAQAERITKLEAKVKALGQKKNSPKPHQPIPGAQMFLAWDNCRPRISRTAATSISSPRKS